MALSKAQLTCNSLSVEEGNKLNSKPHPQIWNRRQTPRLAEKNCSAFNFIQLMNYTIWKEWVILNSPLCSTGTKGRGDKATDHLQ